HGVLAVVGALKECGVRRFGVAHLEEALEIKRVFPELMVMVIGYTPAASFPLALEHGVIQGIFSIEQARELSKAAQRAGKIATLHMKVDTGMGRIGFQSNEISEMIRCAELSHLYIEGIYTHFADADQADLSFARKQLQRFNKVLEQLAIHGIHIPIRHTANSAALMKMPQAHFELVRPGIILYGFPPLRDAGKDSGFEPVLSWKTKISQVKVIGTGEAVSYGRTFRAAYPTRVATIPVGYADGLRRALSNQGEVLVRGERAAIIGRVCMDNTMLEVTKLPEVKAGDVVTLLGADGSERLEATEMAALLGTINYEVLCGISKRVPRVFVD
ncbi:MAG: alanine racemase, partial [Peptococcaceae bacterium]|nr:alanine racemase [Peptococcaceae bacterium]